MKHEIISDIESRSMSSFQITTVTICLILNMLDGFDVLAMAFTAPGIAEDWNVSPQSLGVLFSAAPIGMMLGALFIGPIADKVGRRMIIMIGLGIITVGMLCSSLTQSVNQLLIFRILTGLGIGGLLPSLNTMVAEYSSLKRRDFSISFLHAGYPIGAAIGGSISAFLLLQFGWQSIFVLGGVMSAIMLLVVFRFLPESLEFLLAKQPENSLEKTNQVLAKINHPTLTEMPSSKIEEKTQAVGVRYVLSKNMRATSLLFWSAFFLALFTMFFLLSWIPKILVDAGYTTSAGISGSVLFNVGGVLGGLFLGYASVWFSLVTRERFFLFMSVILMICFVAFSFNYNLLLVCAFILGFFVFGSITGLYAIAPRIYPATVRATGIGWGIGIGRIGAILGPFIAGLLIGNGFSILFCFIFYALVLLLAFFTMLFLKVPEE